MYVKMILYRKFLQIYIVISERIIVKYLRWFLMIQLLSRCMSFDGWAHAICVLCFKRNGHCDLMEVLISYCHSKGSLIINPKGNVCGANLSLTTQFMYISVFPGFWKYLLMILVQELLMTTSIAYIDSPSVWVYAPYTGHDSHEVLQAVRPCYYICRWVLPLHHHPQMYIAWYLVLNVGALIWQVDTKRSNSKIFPNLLV